MGCEEKGEYKGGKGVGEWRAAAKVSQVEESEEYRDKETASEWKQTKDTDTPSLPLALPLHPTTASPLPPSTPSLHSSFVQCLNRAAFEWQAVTDQLAAKVEGCVFVSECVCVSVRAGANPKWTDQGRV